MSTAAFKSSSNSRRNSPKRGPPPRKLKRSVSVSAYSRNHEISIPSDFLNKIENPLFSCDGGGGGSPPEIETNPDGYLTVVTRNFDVGVESKGRESIGVGQRGRSVTRNSDVGGVKKVVSRTRSLSVVDNGRRGRSVLTGNPAFGASESEAEQESVISWNYRGRSKFNQASGSLPEIETIRAEKSTRNSDVGDESKERELSGIGQRGRLVTRNSDVGGNKKVVSRSSSLVDNGRRGRSVLRGNPAFGASKSEVEQESAISSNYRSGSKFNQASGGVKRPVSVRKAADTREKTRSLPSQPDFHQSPHPSVDYASNLQNRSWEDGVSTSSLSEAEEKTIKAVYEQMKSFRGDNLGGEATTSEIYDTVRSEVRRAISDIQNDLESAIRRNNTDAIASVKVNDIPPDLVKLGAVELVLDIRREYAKKLEESEERARQLRSDLAIEEHRGQELSRILKEMLPDPKTSTAHRSRLGRKTSTERKKMSKRLTDEAMSYFDECVSISTFDSSDFSAAEDSALNAVGTTLSMGGSTTLPTKSSCPSFSRGPNSRLNHRQLVHSHEDSSLTAISSCNEPVMDQAGETGKNTDTKFRFSFGHRPSENNVLQQDIRNYIRNFEKDDDKDEIASERVKSSYYDIEGYDLPGRAESLLFDRVLLKSRIESGSLHLCSGGLAVPFFPFASFI